MGGILTCLATETACCFGRAACTCFCKICGSTSSTATRVGYAILFSLSALSSWVMQSDWAERKLSEITHGYLELKCPTGECHGILAVYRITFATTLFHLLMSGMMYGAKTSRGYRGDLQNGYWAWKLLAWLGLVVLNFFIPNGFWMWVGKWVDMPLAGIFVVIQMLLLVDFAWGVSEILLESWENTQKRRYLVALLTLTSLSYAASLTLTILYYVFFSPSCPLNTTFITVNLILVIVLSALSVTPAVQEANPKTGLAQSAMISLYVTYLVGSAMGSEPNGPGDKYEFCNPVNSGSKTATTAMLLGSVFTFLALAYSTTRAAFTTSSLSPSDNATAYEAVPLITDQPRDSTSHLNAAVESGALPSSALYSDNDEDGTFGTPTDDEQGGVQYSYSAFHLIFALAGCYLAMLITNWNTVDKTDEVAVVGKSLAAVWVKTLSGWGVVALYMWTLVAPVVMPDRFGDL